MPLGIAEMLALGEGDGELQQYFARDYSAARVKLNTVDRVKNTLI